MGIGTNCACVCVVTVGTLKSFVLSVLFSGITYLNLGCVLLKLVITLEMRRFTIIEYLNSYALSKSYVYYESK